MAMQTTMTTTTAKATAPTAVQAAAALIRMQHSIETDEENLHTMREHCNATADRRGWQDDWVQSYAACISDLEHAIEMKRATLPELKRAIALEVAREAMRESA